MSFEEAITIETEAEVRDAVSTDLANAGVDDLGFPATSTQRAILDSHAASLARLTELRAYATMAGSAALILDIPEDQGRDAWLRSYFSPGYFGLPPDAATKARHRLVLTNSAVGLERTIAIGALRARGGGIDLINLDAGTLPVGGTLALTFEAQTAGSIGNLPPNIITQLVTAIAGVSINNPPIAGVGSSLVRPARDAERNATLLERDMARWGASSAGGSRGSLVEWIDEAFKYYGITKLVTKWGIDDENPLGPGSTVIYLGTDAGPASTEQITTVKDYYRLRRTRGTGVWDVLPTVLKNLGYSATIYTNVIDAAAKIAAVDTKYTADLAVGGKVLRAELIRRLKNALGLGLNDDIDLVFENYQLDTFEQAVIAGTIAIV